MHASIPLQGASASQAASAALQEPPSEQAVQLAQSLGAGVHPASEPPEPEEADELPELELPELDAVELDARPLEVPPEPPPVGAPALPQPASLAMTPARTAASATPVA
jgi:hypothetical protein